MISSMTLTIIILIVHSEIVIMFYILLLNTVLNQNIALDNSRISMNIDI